MKNLTIKFPKFVEEQAHAFADSEHKRGTIGWKNAVQRYCTDLYEKSLIPAESNPATGEMTVLTEKFPEIFQVFASKKKNKEINQKRLAGLIENLTNMFLELELGMKPHREGDEFTIFEMPKGASLAKQREVYNNRYTRMLLRNLISEALIPIFTMKASDLNAVAKEIASSMDEVQDVNELKSPAFMRSFTDMVREKTNHVFGEIKIREVSLQNQILQIARKKSSAV